MNKLPGALTMNLLLALGLIAGFQPAVADIEADCRQEAGDYQIDSEQVEGYVENCVISRGGYIEAAESEDMGDEQPTEDEQPIEEEVPAE
jgi:hypothetical protein